MDDVKRIYTLLLHSKGLKVREIAKELDLDNYYVAEIMFSEQNIPFWYCNEGSLWFAKEGAIQIDDVAKPKDDKLVSPILVPRKYNLTRFLEGNISDSLKELIKRISYYRVYSGNDLIELIKRARKGDKKAYDLLVKSHQKLVAGIAIMYKRDGVPLEDLIQEGNIGLIKAIEKFDYRKYKNFIAYAKNWILQSISSSIAYLPYPIRLPLNQLALYRKISSFADKYEQEHEFRPPVYDIESGVQDDFDNVALLYKLPDGLEKMTCAVDDMDSYQGNMAPADDVLDKESLTVELQAYLYKLKTRDRKIVEAFFGIGSETGEMDMNAIADRYGLTRERVRQIAWKSVKNMRGDSSAVQEAVKIGDILDVESKKMFGVVRNIIKSKGASDILVLKMSDGTIEKVVEETISYTIVNGKKKNNQSIENKQIIKEDNIVKEERREVSSYDGVNVGDYLEVRNQKCVVKKILVENGNSRLVIQFESGVLDVIPNNKKWYGGIDKTQSSNNAGGRSKVMAIKRSARVGDMIRYDGMKCVVIERRNEKGSKRLIVKYDNGSLDNLHDNQEKYRVLLS